MSFPQTKERFTHHLYDIAGTNIVFHILIFSVMEIRGDENILSLFPHELNSCLRCSHSLKCLNIIKHFIT